MIIIIGVLLIALSTATLKTQLPIKNMQSVKWLGIALIIIGIFSKCLVTVKPGDVGVKVLFGKVNEKNVLKSGLHVINPLVNVVMFDVRTQNYTMSAVHDEGDKEGDDAIRVLTRDGLEITVDLSVLYSVIPTNAPKILTGIGEDYEEKIVRPLTRTRIRDNAVFYQAVELYSEKRDEFQNKIFASIEKEFLKRGLKLEQLLIRNISLPESVKKSIEGKINAEQESQKMTYVLSREKQEAERKRVEAQGIADYQKIINTGLTEQQIKYEQIKALKELAKSDNAKIIVMGNKSGEVLINTGN